MENYNWNWGVLLKDPYISWIISGFYYTIIISVAAWLIAFTLGSVIGILRTVDNKIIRTAATVYVEAFRNIPLLVQMFLWYYVFPELLPASAGNWLKRDMPQPQLFTAILALGLYTASRVAEQVRSGLESIPRGQRNAGLAMGLTVSQVYCYVLIPVSYRSIIPSLTSDFLGVFKNSSIALTIGVLELTAQVRQIEEYTFASFEAFIAATALYCLVTVLVIAAMHIIEARTRVSGAIINLG